MSLQQAKDDLRRFMKAEFGVDLIVSTPNRKSYGVNKYGEIDYGQRQGSAEIKGFATKHRLSINPNTGLPLNSDNIHVSIFEKELTELGYVVRNTKNEVDLIRHIVNFKDSNDLNIDYVIQETWPDNTLGVIVCILGRYGV
jgi:hypothetical protein